MTEQDRLKRFAMDKIAKKIKRQVESIKKNNPNISIEELHTQIDLSELNLSPEQKEAIGPNYIPDIINSLQRFSVFCQDNNIEI